MTLTSISDVALKKFLKSSVENERLSCTKITGFFIRKNRGVGSATFRYQPSSGKGGRGDITIGRTNKLKLSEAALIAVRMIKAINNGDDPKLVLKDGSVEIKRVIPGNPNSPGKLKNYFENVYLPDLVRERGVKAAGDQELIIRREFEHLFEKEMSDLSTTDIHAWQKTHDKKGNAYGTIVRYFKPLCALIGHAIKESYISKGANEGLLLHRPFQTNCLKTKNKDQRDRDLDRDEDVDIVVRRILEKGELKRLAKALREFNQDVVDQRERSLTHSNKQHLPSFKNIAFAHWFVPYFLIAYYTGMRMGDILNLEWKQVREKELVKFTNKSKHNDSPVRLAIDIIDHKGVFDFSLQEVFTKWREQTRHLKSKWVFPQERNAKEHMTVYKKSWSNFLEKTGKGKRGKVVKYGPTLRELAIENDELILDLYSMRHNFISVLCSEGIPLTQIIKLSGHKTTDMIVQHYAHHLPKDMEQAMRLML